MNQNERPRCCANCYFFISSPYEKLCMTNGNVFDLVEDWGLQTDYSTIGRECREFKPRVA